MVALSTAWKYRSIGWLSAAVVHWHAISLRASQDAAPHAALTPHVDHASTFDRWFELYERRVFSYLFRLTSDQQLASDLAQETFLRAWQHMEKLSHYQDPLGWLFHVATNLALNAQRNRAYLHRVTTVLDEDHDPAGADTTSSIAEGELVHAILQELSPRSRAALVLREVYGFSLEEVARTLGVNPGAVKKMLSRARERFRVRYLEEGATP